MSLGQEWAVLMGDVSRDELGHGLIVLGCIGALMDCHGGEINCL